jgi:DNA-binding protein YbaB
MMYRTEFDGYDEEETVKVVFLGDQKPVKCELTQAAMECDAEELQKRIEEAMADAHEKCASDIDFLSCRLLAYVNVL